ncbi:MAG: hypothetical protein HFE61_11610 [Anaerotignum sp.]|jgi:hypothetical protein|nr:hypothetical protein [Anaerotignum sp.]
MDFRIGAKSPVYGARQTAKVTDKQLKQSFAMKMAEVRPPRQDTMEISGNPLAQRLENVHQKINEMDFTGKSSEEVYKSIIDAYDEEFGFVGNMGYSDYDSYLEIESDRRNIFKEKVPGYELRKESELHYRAMGYDKMTKAEKIEAISKRVGGNSYIHKYGMLDELARAEVLTWSQKSDIHWSLHRKLEEEYCATHGMDYIQWSMGKDISEKGMMLREKSLMAWAAKTDVTWFAVFESIYENPALRDETKDVLIKELEGTSELLIGSDKI